MNYESYRDRVTALAARTDSDAHAEYRAIESAYPEYATRLATELCAEESREREWEL